MFAAEIVKKRVTHMRGFTQWRWHLAGNNASAFRGGFRLWEKPMEPTKPLGS